MSLLAVTTVAHAEGPPEDVPGVVGSIESGQAKEPAATRKKTTAAREDVSDFSLGAVSRTATIADARTDQTNDGTVVRAQAVQDLAAQRLRATITLEPDVAARVVAVFFGEFEGGSCIGQAAIFGATTGSESGGQFLPGTTNTFPVTRSRSGSTLTLTSAQRPAFRSAAYDCAYVAVLPLPASGQNDPTQFFWAEGLTTNWQPAFTIKGGEPLQAARRGKWVDMRLEVRNTSRSAANDVRIRAAGKGLRIKPKARTLGTIDDRTTEYGVTFKVRVAKGKKSRKLTYTVTAPGARPAKKKFTIGVAPKPRKYKSLAGRYFWGFANTSASSTKGWDTQVIWFLDKKWAHFGEPKNGRKPKCRRTSKACKKYTYNPRKGIVRISGRKAKVTTYGFTYTAPKDELRHYEPATLPKKGQRYGTSLINNDWTGNCLLSCTVTVSHLTLDRKGRFVHGSFSVGSWLGLGSSWAVIPPDQRGRYTIVSKGRVRLQYSSGRTEFATMGLAHDALNRPSATSGVFLGTTNFYFQD